MRDTESVMDPWGYPVYHREPKLVSVDIFLFLAPKRSSFVLSHVGVGIKHYSILHEVIVVGSHKPCVDSCANIDDLAMQTGFRASSNLYGQQAILGCKDFSGCIHFTKSD